MNNEEKIINLLENLNIKVDSMDLRLNNVETRLDTMENRFDSLETKFDGLESRFSTMESRFDSLESQIKENTQILKALEHKALLDQLNHRVANVEEKVASLLKDLNFIEGAVGKNITDIACLKSVK